MVAVSRAGHFPFLSSEFYSPVYQSFCHDLMFLINVCKASRTISIHNKGEENISFLRKEVAEPNMSTFIFKVQHLKLLHMGKKSGFTCYMEFS